MVNKIELAKTGLMISQIALGCMRICDLSKKDCENLIETALGNGISFLTTLIFTRAAKPRLFLRRRSG